MKSVGEYIREHEGAILERWNREAGNAGASRGLLTAELDNSVPLLLRSLASLGSDGEGKRHRRALIERHYSARLRAGFELSEMHDELALLGRCVADLWEHEPPGARPDVADAARFFAELQDAARRMTELFATHMAEDVQADKRWTRLLEQATRQALEDRSQVTRERLAGVLEVIAEATDAASVTLLLYDKRRQMMVARSSVGLADEAIESYASELGPESFVGKVVAEEEGATEMLDVQTTDLEISDTLRTSGVRSMLGVRLPSRHDLLGVMTIGRRETAAFAGRVRRRLELLGDRLSLHLDVMRLIAQLEDTIRSLRAEREARERFVAVLAHDLRSPLTAASLLAQMLARDESAAAGHRDVATQIASNIRRTDHMVRDILDVARLESGATMPLDPKPIRLEALLAPVLAELRAAHGERFTVEIDEDLEVCWDAEFVRRAVWNLGSNAVKYGAADEPITIHAMRADDGVCIAVHNHGGAISPEAQARLFQPFVQVDPNGQRQAGGWGLGMASVRACAQAHGGRVGLHSSEASGTAFTLELPFGRRGP